MRSSGWRFTHRMASTRSTPRITCFLTRSRSSALPQAQVGLRRKPGVGPDKLATVSVLNQEPAWQGCGAAGPALPLCLHHLNFYHSLKAVNSPLNNPRRIVRADRVTNIRRQST